MAGEMVGGVDASIPLGVHAFAPKEDAAGGGGFGPLNSALGVMGKSAEIANQQNQNRLFQQTFAAKQRAGQIMAAAPSVEAGLQALVKDPVAGPFAGEYVSQMREAQLAQVQMGLVATQKAGAEQEQAMNGYHAVMQGLASGAQDPTMIGPVVDGLLKTLSPAARARVQPSVNMVIKSLSDGLPTDDPVAARSQFSSRLMGLAIASGGMAPDTVRALTGQLAPQVVQVPDASGALTTKIIGGPATEVPDYPTGPNDFRVPEGGASSASDESANALGGGEPTQVAASGAAGSRTLGAGPSTEKAKLNEGLGAAGADVQQDMSTVAAAIPLQITRMNQIVDALGQFQAGGFADIRGEGGKLLQGLKGLGLEIPQSVIDKVANGSLPSTQEFAGLVKRLATSQLTADAKGQGRVLKPEVDAALAQLDVTQDPQAIIGIMNYTKKQYQIAADMADKFLDFKRELGKPLASQAPDVRGLHQADFYQWYNRHFEPLSLPSKLGGMDLGPIPASAAAGGTPAFPDYGAWQRERTAAGLPVGLPAYNAAKAAAAGAGPTKKGPDLGQFLK